MRMLSHMVWGKICPFGGTITMTTMFQYGLSRLGILSLIALVWSMRLAVAQATPAQVWLILHLLDNVAADYPQCVQDGTVLDQFRLEYNEQVEFSRRVRVLLRQLSAHAARSGLLSKAEQLVTLIQDRRPGPEVSALAQRLYWHVIRTYNVEIAPQRPPDLATVVVLYQAQCASCHGLQGQGDGPVGANLDPTPSNFHDRQRMDQRSIYDFYRTMTLGVQGTAMASFRTLSEDKRWALAFYIHTLASSTPDLTRGAELWQSGIGRTWFPDLARVATATAREMHVRHGDDGVHGLAYLRSQPHVVVSSSESLLARSSRLLRESLAAYQGGQQQVAQDLALTAYLDGFELVEASLDVVDKRLRMVVEAEMMRYRAMLKHQEPIVTVAVQHMRIQEFLTEATTLLDRTRLPAGVA